MALEPRVDELSAFLDLVWAGLGRFEADQIPGQVDYLPQC
jgi:hypothetical protein